MPGPSASTSASARSPLPDPAPLPAMPFARLNEVLRHERSPLDTTEARAVLLEIARRKSGRLPAEWLVNQALRVSEGTDWPAQRAALEALLRRMSFAARDELSIEQRPAGGVLGGYALSGRPKGGDRRRSKSERRPYRVELYGLEPLAASCDCADYLRSSLGLCKHLLVVLEDISKRRSKASANEEPPAEKVAPRLLTWQPVRAWTGTGDRLEGLRWSFGGRAEAREALANLTATARLEAQGRTALEAALAGGRAAPSLFSDLDARAALVAALLARFDRDAGAAEPAALALLREEHERVARLAAGRAASAEALPHLSTLRRELYPYQREGVERFLARQRLLLADDMGLGKTTQAIAACHALYEAGRVQRGLLIVPAPLKEQWLREWQSTTLRAPVSAVDGSAEERVRIYAATERGFLIINYEQLLRDLGAVQRFAPSLVILDEAQRIKNWATKSSAYVMSLEPEWRLVLTGTPLENRLEELATLLDWVDDAALAPKWRLSPWHTAWATQGSSERVGARHLDTLRTRLEPCLLRRVRREVLRQLPARSDVRVPVELTAPQREEHDARTVPIAQLLAAGRRRPLRQPEFLKLMQLLAQQRIISNGLLLLRFDEMWPVYGQARADEALLASGASPKLGELRRVVRQLVLEQGRKVVIFSQWRKMLRLAEWAVRDLLEEAGLSSVFFTGEESQRLRTRNVVSFHDDPSVCVMFLSDAGGVGLNLQRAASACINLELPWNPAVLEQRIGRIYRLGQRDPVDVINLVTEQGIEARIAGLVDSKHALFSGLFDGTTDAVRFEGPSSFLGDIERLVEAIEVPDLGAADDATETSDDATETPDDALEAEARGAPELETPVRDVSGDGAPPPDGEPSPAPPARAPALDVAQLFADMVVTRTPDGGLRIEAPPSAAAQLSELLVGLAGLLRAASPRDT